MTLCPLCGSDRLIPLSFAEDDVPDEIGERPVAKCALCGHQVYEAEIEAHEESSRK
jgi:hypothetical protein